MNEWEKQEEQRNSARDKYGRLTFDCYNLKCSNERAICSKGHYLGLAKDGGMILKDVLNGKTSGTCRNCEDFDGGE